MRDFITIAEGLATPAATLIARVKTDVMPSYAGLAEVDLCEHEPKLVEIEHIAAFVQKQGTGSKLLGEICRLADDLGVTLTLGVANETDGYYCNDDCEDGDPSEDDLIYWYGNFGFEQQFTISDRITMVRQPG